MKIALLICALILGIIITTVFLPRNDSEINAETKPLAADSATLISESVVPDIAEINSPEEIVKGDGYGMLSNPDGAVYMGDIKNGLSHGIGKVTYPGGASYKGEFSEGWPHGNGVCTYSSGESQACEFIMGQRQ